MSIASVEGVVVALFLVLPGAAAGTAMRYWTGYPQESGSLEPLVKSVARSLSGLMIVEFANLLLTTGQFGDFLLSHLLATTSAAAIDEQLVIRYLAFLMCTVAVWVSIRQALMTDAAERLLGKRTIVVPPLYQLRRYHPPEATENESKGPEKRRRPAPFVKVSLTGDTAGVEGWLIWSSDGTEADPALVIRDELTEGVTMVPLASVVAMRVIDRRYQEDAPN